MKMFKLLCAVFFLCAMHEVHAQQLCPVGNYNFNGQCLNNTAGVATIQGQTGTGASGKGGGLTFIGGLPLSPSTATGDVTLFSDPSNPAINFKCSQPTAGNTGTAVCTGNNIAISSSGGASGPSVVTTLTLKNASNALDQKLTQLLNTTISSNIGTYVCAESDAGVVSTTDCLEMLRGSGATFNGFGYFDSTGNNFSFTGNDLVINEPNKNPLVFVQDSNSGSFTGFGAFNDTGTNEVAGGEICFGRTNAFGVQFTGGSSPPSCALGTNSTAINVGGTIVVPQSVGANGVVFLEGNGNTYTDMWVGPTPVKISHATYAAGVTNATYGSSANASNVTNIVGGSAANTQVNGVQIASTQTGTFTITYTGMTAGVTGTARWNLSGNIVTLFFPAATGTSNATTFTATGLPAAIQPTSTKDVFLCDAEDNTASTQAVATFTNASGTVTLSKGFTTAGAWTASGTKGVMGNGCAVSYPLN